jgi:hypothetical protein
MSPVEPDETIPVEDFVHAVQSQLDRVQQAMGMKARAGLPLTFAVTDLAIDLRAQVEMRESVVRIRPATADEPNASTLHITFGPITRPMMEENSRPPVREASIRDELGDQLSEEQQRRLEWAGVSTLSQLRQLGRQTDESALERVSSLPVGKLRAALTAAARPQVHGVVAVPRPGNGGGALLRIRGANLLGEDGSPTVSLGGRALDVLSAGEEELVAETGHPDPAGELEVRTGPEAFATALVEAPA